MKKFAIFKYVGNFSTNSSNGFAHGIGSNNYRTLKRDLIDMIKNYGGRGRWFIKVYDKKAEEYIPFDKGVYRK